MSSKEGALQQNQGLQEGGLAEDVQKFADAAAHWLESTYRYPALTANGTPSRLDLTDGVAALALAVPVLLLPSIGRVLHIE